MSKSSKSPRMSVIPGEFAGDPRADLGHFRVLNAIGRHTDRHGWCRIKQARIGDICGLTRETVNRKIRDLVTWGYVEKCSQDSTGRSIWYRVILDRPGKPWELAGDPSDLDDSDDADGAEEVESGPVTDDAQVRRDSGPLSGVRRAIRRITSGVGRAPIGDVTQAATARTISSSSSSSTLPPTPSAPRRGRERKVEALIAEIRQHPGRDAIVDALFAPLLRQRQLSAPVPAYAAGALADWAAGWPPEVWTVALDKLLVARKVKVYQADIRSALQEAKSEHAKREAARLASEEMARREAEDPNSPRRQALADHLVTTSALGERALAEDWLPELRAWCAEYGGMPTTDAEIATIVAKRDALLAKWSEERTAPDPISRKTAESSSIRRADTIKRLSKLMGVEPPKQEDAA